METLTTCIFYDNSDLCWNCNGARYDCTNEPCHVCRGTGSIMFKLSFCNNGVRNMRIATPAGVDTWAERQKTIRKIRTTHQGAKRNPLLIN